MRGFYSDTMSGQSRQGEQQVSLANC